MRAHGPATPLHGAWHGIRSLLFGILVWSAQALLAAEEAFPREGHWQSRFDVTVAGERVTFFSLSKLGGGLAHSPDPVPPEAQPGPDRQKWRFMFYFVDMSSDSMLRLDTCSVDGFFEGADLVIDEPAWEARYRWKIVDGRLELTLRRRANPELTFPAWMDVFPKMIGESARFPAYTAEAAAEMKARIHRHLDRALR